MQQEKLNVDILRQKNLGLVANHTKQIPSLVSMLINGGELTAMRNRVKDVESDAVFKVVDAIRSLTKQETVTDIAKENEPFASPAKQMLPTILIQ